MNTRAAWFVVGAIVLGWFLTIVVFPAVIHGYQPPAEASTGLGSIMGVVIALVAANHTRNGKNGNGNGAKKPPPSKDDE